MKVNQSVVANQETKLNQDGKPVEVWGEGDYEIPVIIDMDSVDENGMIAGISKRDLKTKRVCDRTKKVVFVRGTKKQYDAVMDTYSKEFKAEARDRRCTVKGESGKLIRCPEQVKDPVTGEMKCNSCKNCPYYYSMDKKDYYTASFSDLSTENEQGDVTEFEPGSSDMMPSGDRYLKILEDLIAHVTEINPLYGDIIRMREQGVGQADIAKNIGKSQASVAAYLKALKPVIEEFMDNLIY